MAYFNAMRIYFQNHIKYLKIGLQDARKYAQKRKKYFEKVEESDKPLSQLGYYTGYKDIWLFRQACVYCISFAKSENLFTTVGHYNLLSQCVIILQLQCWYSILQFAVMLGPQSVASQVRQQQQQQQWCLPVVRRQKPLLPPVRRTVRIQLTYLPSCTSIETRI